MRPQAVLIDGGSWSYLLKYINIAVTLFFSLAVIQTTDQGPEFNLESSLDLEYGLALTNPQQITLLQVGDLIQG